MTQYSPYMSQDEIVIEQDINIEPTIENIIYGTERERGRGIWVVVQRLMRDSNDVAIESPNNYKLTNEGSREQPTAGVTRTGFLCVEQFIKVLYRPASRMIMDEITAPTGVQPMTRDVMYFCKRDYVREHDCIIFVKKDDNGNILNPVTADKELVISKVYPKALDDGKVQYYVGIVEEQK